MTMEKMTDKLPPIDVEELRRRIETYENMTMIKDRRTQEAETILRQLLALVELVREERTVSRSHPKDREPRLSSIRREIARLCITKDGAV